MVFKVFSIYHMTTTTRASKRLVYIFLGEYFDKKKNKTLTFRFDSQTREINPDESYELIDTNDTDKLPYSVKGENIINPRYQTSRPYLKD